MLESIRAQWTDALRSGDYVKGEKALHKVETDDDGKVKHSFCCLGVLCELAVEAGVVERRLRGNEDQGRYYYYNAHDEWAGSDSVLPEVVRKWAGLGSENPNVDLTKNASEAVSAVAEELNTSRPSVAEVNDVGESVQFDLIADLIETNL